MSQTGYSISETLAPKQIIGVFSRVKPALRTLSTLFGFNIGGANRTSYQGVGRSFSYDVFNSTRKVAPARSPAQPSQEIAPQKVGEVSGTFPRSAFKMALLDEKICNQRPIGGPVANLDAMGLQYITRQEMFMAEQVANIIEFQTAAMLRGAYYYTESGDNLAHTWDSSGAAQTIDFKVPSGNKSTLAINGGSAIITASWSSPTTDIPGQLLAIKKASQGFSGYTPTNIVCKSPLWNSVVNNDYVVAQAGSSNQPFESFDLDAESGNAVAVLRGIPWLKWHILDHGLEVGTTPTYTDILEDNKFWMFPDPSAEWCQYLDGPEMVTEGPGYNAPRAMQYGTYAYAYPTFDPSGWIMHSLHNGIPALYNPNCVFYGDAS